MSSDSFVQAATDLFWKGAWGFTFTCVLAYELIAANKLENVKLEFDYLSSAETLINYQNLYFENKLAQKSINEIKIIDTTTDKILTNDFKIIDTEN